MKPVEEKTPAATPSSASSASSATSSGAEDRAAAGPAAAEEEIYMVNLVGLGIGVDANIRADWWRCCGPFRYDWAILLEICALDVNKGDPQTVTVFREAPAAGAGGAGETTRFGKGCGVIMIQNTIHGGAGLKLAPNALIDDGYMDVVWTDKMGCCGTLDLFSKVKAGGTHLSDGRVTEKRFKKLTFSSEKELMVNVDGENCGRTPVEVLVKPSMFQIFA
mmetsp:Transcript_37494/g.99196  ORF Transcript_37494/g.99196 Transcript_37494/m.99196 type:complete len:220 (+) Transcript_37494:2-661(+)